MKKKIIFMVVALIIILSSVGITLAWFYFPNSKGLEIDTAPALDFEINVYRIQDNYVDGNYSNSEIVNITNTLAYNDHEGAEVTATYDDENKQLTIPETFEFFQWGDEFICEDTKAIYYALEISYDSDAFNDGYIKSVLSSNLVSSGSFIFDENTYYANFPVMKASYKYASSATIMNTSLIAMDEMKNESGYKEVMNGTDYYILDNSSYKLVDRFIDFDEDETYYTTDLVKCYNVKAADLVNNQTYYTYDNTNHSFTLATSYSNTTQYYKSSDNEAFSIANIAGYAKSNSTFSLERLNYNIETVFKDEFKNNGVVDDSVFVNHTDNKLQFVVFIKIEPDEKIVTSKMDELSEYTSELTEIEINNVLTLDLSLRSVPYVEGQINE